MSTLRRNFAWYVLAVICLLGCVTFLLSLHSPKSTLAMWLESEWKNLGALIATIFLLVRLFRPHLVSASCPAPHKEQASDPIIPSWSNGVPALADLVVGSMEWNRAKAIHDGVHLLIPDAVYRIVEFNEWWSQFRIAPGELFWLDSEEQFDVWSRKALMLRNGAYRVGDAGLSKCESYEEVRMKFISDNPGFNDDTYERAIRFGYRQAR